jgi:proliferating cell nuclear antigen PCNA
MSSKRSSSKSKKTFNEKKNSQSVRKSKKILEVKTIQTGAFKQAIERISNVISDCCIVFFPLKNQYDQDYSDNDNDADQVNKKSKPVESVGGIRILRLTEDRNILIKLSLEAENFEYFICEEPKITIGVDMQALNTLLKIINDDDPIIIYMYKDDKSVLYIKSIAGVNSNREETDLKIFLMEIPNREVPIPKTKFQNIITIDSNKFHTICKQLHNNSTFVEIKSVKNQISFRGQNEGGTATKTYKDHTTKDDKKKRKKNKDADEPIVQGIFDLKSIMGFSKCNKLCPTVNIYLRNDFPLVLQIPVASLGKMFVFFTPLDNPDEQN